MDRLREFREVSVSTLNKMRRPELFLPAVLTFIIPQVLSMGFLRTVVDLTRAGSAGAFSQRADQYGGLFILLGLFLLVCLPAVASGMAAQARAAVETGGGRFSDFWSGLGTYYWRLVGAYALAILAQAIFSAPFGGVRAARVLGTGGSIVPWLLYQGGVLVGTYFFTPWIAAAALDGTGVMASISRGARFAWQNPYLLLPGFALHKLTEYLANLVSGSAYAPDSSLLRVSVPPGWLAYSLVGGAVSGYLTMFFTVLYFGMYRMRNVPPVPGSQAPIAQAPPPAPPLDSAQGPEE